MMNITVQRSLLQRCPPVYRLHSWCAAQRNYASQTSSMVARDFLSLKYYTDSEITTLLWTALDLKQLFTSNDQSTEAAQFKPLRGKTVALLFQKRDLGTRLSSETGLHLLGGTSVIISPEDIDLTVQLESGHNGIKATAKILSTFTDLVLARVQSHDDIEDLSRETNVPVINGFSSLHNPLQTLSDLMTLQEHFDRLRGLSVAWVGDGNNAINSLLLGGIKMGLDMRVATPIGYECPVGVTRDAINIATGLRSNLMFTNDPKEAVHKADVIVTDTWISNSNGPNMGTKSLNLPSLSEGNELERVQRIQDFAGFQINHKLMSHAAPGCVFLHSLPRGQHEVTDHVFNMKESLVWKSMENRRWTTMAVMLHLLSEYKPSILKPSFDGNFPPVKDGFDTRVKKSVTKIFKRSK